MKEFNLAEKGLTTQAPKAYSKGGDIFMAESGQQGEQQPRTPAPGEMDQQDPAGEARKDSTEAHPKTSKEAEPHVKNQEQENGKAQGGIFSHVSNIPTDEAELEKMAIKDLEGEGKGSGITKAIESGSEKALSALEFRKQQLKNARDFIRGVEMNARMFGRNPAQSLSEIIEGVKTGRIDPITAEPYMQQLAEAAAEQKPEMTEQEGRTWGGVLADIESKTGYERTKALKDIIEEINPDSQLDDAFLNLVARDDEASEQLVAKIVYKPFATPEAEYSLSWYASINFESFLTAVGNVKEEISGRKSEARRQNYKEQHEMALRLHEANKAIVTQSANIDGLMNIARTITPERLQTGIELDGVEQARQIFGMAFGRLYSNYSRIQAQQYQTEIAKWAEDTFKSEIAKTGIKSRFNGPDGKQRDLEDWELNRAAGLGRDYEATLLRVPEMMSWGDIPKPTEEWLRSMPSETLTRIIGGFKLLQGRFRSAVTKGGPTFIHILDQETAKDYKGALNKIGVLDIRQELLPLGFFSAGGFEKGWRPVGSYLNTPFMKIDISKIPEMLRKLRGGKEGETERTFKKYLEEQKHGDISAETNLGEFLVYNTGFLNEFYGQDISIKGFPPVPKELTPTDYDKSKLMMGDMFLSLMGFSLKPEKAEEFVKLRERIEKYEAKGLRVRTGEKARKDLFSGRFVKNAKGEDVYEYDYFNYDPSQDQVDFSLGLILSTGGISTDIKTLIWQKIADTMPLRIAYFLSEEKVKDIPFYKAELDRVKREANYKSSLIGEKLSNGGYGLFNKEFERKLIRLHMIRMREQKKKFEASGKHRALKLSDYFEEAGLTSSEEQNFVKELQKLGREKAYDLAQVSFPHVAFLDDVPFQKAEYRNLGAEVYARRMNDQRGYSEARDAAGGLVDHLGVGWGEVKKHLKEMSAALGGPEGSQTAQNVAAKLVKPYLIMAKQFDRSKIPGYKTIAEFMNKPTSQLQKLFSTNSNSWNIKEMSLNIRDLAADDGIIRNEKIPGEKDGQVRKLLREFGAQPLNVAWSELLNALTMWLLFTLLNIPSGIKNYGKR